MTNKVMAAMSGGVDSAIAAALLIDSGYEVYGATLKLFDRIDDADVISGHTQESDADLAKRIAAMLSIDHVVFDIAEQFKAEVIARFANAYLAGFTPNPCVDCNRNIKFGLLLDKALERGMDYIATGHYANVEKDDSTGRYLLKKASDLSKDQTYVLYTLTQDQLKRILFPLGNLTKTDVRALAQKRGLTNAQKKDSQDICFVPDGDYATYIETILGITVPPGPFTDMDGRVLGKHRGLIHYTIGQRRGLNMSFDRPKYVVSKDASTNTVVIGDERDLYSVDMTVQNINLIAIENLTAPVRATVKTRYSQKEASALLSPLSDDTIAVRFDAPQRAVTAGQSAVFYQGDIVLGGGIIV